MHFHFKEMVLRLVVHQAALQIQLLESHVRSWQSKLNTRKEAGPNANRYVLFPVNAIESGSEIRGI